MFMSPKRVTLRTLDAGADKFVKTLGSFDERNPALGLRAIRLCMQQQNIEAWRRAGRPMMVVFCATCRCGLRSYAKKSLGLTMYVLFQPIELLIIGGAALGSFFISAPKSIVIGTFKHILHVFTGKEPSAADFQDLLTLLYELINIARRDGIVALEPHVSKPEQSATINRYPAIAKNKQLAFFICDNIKALLSEGIDAHRYDDLMRIEPEVDIERLPAVEMQRQGQTAALDRTRTEREPIPHPAVRDQLARGVEHVPVDKILLGRAGIEHAIERLLRAVVETQPGPPGGMGDPERKGLPMRKK